jgi:hypothetical protein
MGSNIDSSVQIPTIARKPIAKTEGASTEPLSLFTIEWIPNLFEKTQTGELLIKFHFDQLNISTEN